jgi:hypothetical protein
MASRTINIDIRVTIDNDNVNEITDEMVDDIFRDMDRTFHVGEFEVETNYIGILEDE